MMFIVKKVIAMILLYWWITGIVLDKTNREIFYRSVRIMLDGMNIGMGILAILMLVGMPVAAILLLFS